ncbi:voltage-gated monoatomic cation channel TMEM109 isoform X1 [Nerophis lumbriciformis]|uniref:voltage-gated monoatomic cation channel TMEM109 isoform X1 n=1 Tax=Nerophis lumbriciformis TaxID=546530 RepID=UPI002ADF8F36|nr:voltage-gated monoatomic cation channel TMEM109-like isoform X1 [Nerophis lumbriciformis]
MAFNVGLSAAARILLLLLTSTVLHAEAEQARHATEKESPPTVTLRSLFRGTSQELHQYAESLLGTGVIRSAVESALLFLESLLGQENVYSVAMFLQMVIRCVAEGASSGLNVIAVYVTEILRVTGFDATFTLPRFTPEGVITVAQWGVLALMGYWGLTILLRLVVGTLRQVFWLVKMAVVLWLFAMIVSDKSASGDTTAVRLGGLVLAYILLSLLTSGSDQTGVLEHRLRSLEGRVKAVEKKKGNN